MICLPEVIHKAIGLVISDEAGVRLLDVAIASSAIGQVNWHSFVTMRCARNRHFCGISETIVDGSEFFHLFVSKFTFVFIELEDETVGVAARAVRVMIHERSLRVTGFLHLQIKLNLCMNQTSLLGLVRTFWLRVYHEGRGLL